MLHPSDHVSPHSEHIGAHVDEGRSMEPKVGGLFVHDDDNVDIGTKDEVKAALVQVFADSCWNVDTY